MKKYKFTIRGNVYEVELHNIEGNIANIEVNGTKYKVEVHEQIQQSKTPVLMRQAMPSPLRGESKIKKALGQNSIKAPLPGNIMQVFISEGATVSKGDKLLMYEAMKMENNILADRDGKILSLKVKPGDSVLEGDVLIEMG